MAEIFRAGINAVPRGQIEAARSLGLSRWQTARQVILPQAFRIVIPPMGNEFIAILKDTSLLSILSIRDLTQRMRELQSATFLTFAFAGFFQQLGVDQGQQLRLAFGNVDHDQTHVPVDL